MSAPLAGYVRVSHVGGRAGDRFHSPTEQEAEIRTWAKAHGLEVELLPPELDAKGSDPNRKVFRQIIDGVKAGVFSGMAVAYISRAGRDLRLMLDVWEEVERAGGRVFSARENIDGATPQGRLHRNLLASISQAELEERREGFERSVRSAVERGIWKARQTPLGYDRDGETRRLVPNHDAAKVRALFVARAAGEHISPLARRVGMTPSGVRGLLRNRVYLGELRERGYVNLTAHPRLVDAALFEAAQRSQARPPRAQGAQPGLLTGLVRCAGCGHVMSPSKTSRPVYTCHRVHSGALCATPAAITARLLDEHVETIALRELAQLSVHAAANRNGVERAQATLEVAQAELDAYLEAVSPLDVGRDTFRAHATKRSQAVDDARALLRDELARQPANAALNGSGVSAWGSMDNHARNLLLRGLLTAVVVRSGGGRGSRTPLTDRVRVLKYGADFDLPTRRGGVAMGVVPLDLPDADDPRVLRLAGTE